MKDRTKEIKYLMYIKGQLIKETKRELKELRDELTRINYIKTKRRKGRN